MYITAHLVKSSDHHEGINAFVHLHGTSYPWPEDASSLPETAPGTTVLSRTDLLPGGNSVRAYIDLVAPDGTPREALEQALSVFAADLQERRNPTVFRHGPVTIRFGVELGLEALRAEQLKMLSSAAMLLANDAPSPG